MTAKLNILLVIIFFGISHILFAETGEELFAKANKLYEDGNFVEAAQNYEAIINGGFESAELYFNLGNACYKTNRYTDAILYYEKAKRLAPEDEDIESNLQLVVSHFVVDNIEEIPELLITKWIRNFRSGFSPDTWAFISVGCFILFLLLTSLFLYSKSLALKKLGFAFGIVFLLTAIVTFNFSRRQLNYLVSHNEAVIYTPTLTVRSAPEDSGSELFVLHEGTKVEIQRESGNTWCEIRLKNGKVGWIKLTDIKKI